MMKHQCHKYLANLSTVFGYVDRKKGSFTLHHNALNVGNILVDHESSELHGVVA